MDNTTIDELLPSYYWPQNAVVIVTACGHKHVRPKNVDAKVGDPFQCPFCEDQTVAAGETQP
jgi:uncharacterized Zn-binding protein involved in type VI secretion